MHFDKDGWWYIRHEGLEAGIDSFYDYLLLRPDSNVPPISNKKRSLLLLKTYYRLPFLPGNMVLCSFFVEHHFYYYSLFVSMVDLVLSLPPDHLVLDRMSFNVTGTCVLCSWRITGNNCQCSLSLFLVSKAICHRLWGLFHTFSKNIFIFIMLSK